MRLAYSGTDRVPMPEAKRRALRALDRSRPLPASMIADEIWPGNKMRAQGAGAAASRILVALRKEGKACWIHDGKNWGWIKTP